MVGKTVTKHDTSIECAKCMMGKGYLTQAQIQRVSMMSTSEAFAAVKALQNSDRVVLKKRKSPIGMTYKVASIDGQTTPPVTRQQLWRTALFGIPSANRITCERLG